MLMDSILHTCKIPIREEEYQYHNIKKITSIRTGAILSLCSMIGSIHIFPSKADDRYQHGSFTDHFIQYSGIRANRDIIQDP